MTEDPWAALRRHTSARIALGRAGGSLPTREVLAFSAAHAGARDAVHAPLDADRLVSDLRPLGLSVMSLHSAAPDRATYLQRPDLGRRLDEGSRRALASHRPAEAPGLAVVVSDGLSAPAAQRHAAPLLAELLPLLRGSSISISPVVIVRHARVAVQDEVGQALGARAALILLGERPGLGSPDSLGAYLVFDPRPGRTDAERNCVSNIRPGGLPYPAAAATLHYLITESRHRQLRGVGLKDDRAPLIAPAEGASLPDS
jgi:ethanolamine ammonia-lyase small subunit